MSKTIHVFDRAEMLQMYLDWFNNFLTVPRFAEYYGISEETAGKVIDIGRDTLNNQLYEGRFVTVRHN